MTRKIKIDDFPANCSERIRYCDTDRQGHVNNAVAFSLLESGRVRILNHPDHPLTSDGAVFVIVRLLMDFRREIRWPADVAIGTAVLRLGRSSITFGQGMFVDGACVAVAETVIVLMDEKSRRSQSLSSQARSALGNWIVRGVGDGVAAPEEQGL